MTTITINAENITELEAAGFNRWTKGNMDRLYVSIDTLGLEVETYKSGNAKSEGIWCGAEVFKCDANDILHSKVWIDVATGELHVVTDFKPCYGEMTVEDAAIAFINSVIGTREAEHEDEAKPEAETIKINAENTLNGNFIGAPLRSCKPVDRPTKERVTVELDGKTYERTIYERVTWRNSAKSSVRARFVIINGTNYLV